jgi:lipoprotein-anchoring transpeptidase ErfK/SrfK
MRTASVGIAVVLVLLAVPVAHAEDKVAATAASAVAVVDEGAVAKLGAPAATATATGGALPLSVAIDLAKELAVPPPPPPITLTLKVDLRAQRVTVQEGNSVKHVWPISSGRGGYATQTGTFQPQWTSKMWYSRQWDMAPMPHAVFFNKGTAFHATNAVGSLGRPASHGCIRLAPANAAKLYSLVHRHGLASTKVIVHGPSSGPAIARRNNKGQNRQAAAGPRKVTGFYPQAYAANGAYQARPPAQRTSRRGSPAIWGF